MASRVCLWWRTEEAYFFELRSPELLIGAADASRTTPRSGTGAATYGNAGKTQKSTLTPTKCMLMPGFGSLMPALDMWVNRYPIRR
jgi:hypothetical protein